MNSNIVRSLKIFSSSAHILHVTAAKRGPVSRKSRKFFGPEKPFVKTPTCLFFKAGLFICCKRNKIKITATFLASRRLRFEDTKRIMSPEMRPKSLGTFERNGPPGHFTSLKDKNGGEMCNKLKSQVQNYCFSL